MDKLISHTAFDAEAKPPKPGVVGFMASAG